ncbi:hypothetical protein [Pedobacter frigoris]|uniref:hypothetical protein n=1 Tax=Pedobacter frigoris TaxID=2571272 RepID=UPI00292D5413|nr:hypothetical protein [Pedobacter frigoris]
MEQKREMEDVYDILLAVPGMEDMVTLNTKVKRKNILLLAQLIHQALTGDGKQEGSVMSVLSKDTLEELKAIADDFLGKGNLETLNEKISKFRLK